MRFTERNALGVLDHDVVLPSGVTIHNPIRVLPNGEGSEVAFTLFRQPGVSAVTFEEDAKAVERDLRALKAVLEEKAAAPQDHRPGPTPPHVHQTIDYIEITVTDLPEAKRFYFAAFGWTFNDYGPHYAGIQGEGREAGGLCRAQPTCAREVPWSSSIRRPSTTR